MYDEPANASLLDEDSVFRSVRHKLTKPEKVRCRLHAEMPLNMASHAPRQEDALEEEELMGLRPSGRDNSQSDHKLGPEEPVLKKPWTVSGSFCGIAVILSIFVALVVVSV